MYPEIPLWIHSVGRYGNSEINSPDGLLNNPPGQNVNIRTEGEMHSSFEMISLEQMLYFQNILFRQPFL